VHPRILFELTKHLVSPANLPSFCFGVLYGINFSGGPTNSPIAVMGTAGFNLSCRAADELFGPAVPPQCRGGFDFTLFFEQAILSILPCTAFVLFSFIRLIKLYQAPLLVQINKLHSAKLVAIAAYAALQLVSLVLWSLSPTYRTRASIPSAVLCLTAAIVLSLVSHYEHIKRLRPSTLLAGFLTITLLFDVAITRTLRLIAFKPALAIVYTFITVVKSVLLILEAQEKTPRKPLNQASSPESLSSIYSRSFFWWINPLFLKGFKNTLTVGLRYLDV
jgi:ATP-binding cassette, subfamily C (CFTR/MRP), member 1